MIRRPPRSTQSRSSAASDVYKRQLSLPVAPLQFVEVHDPLVDGYEVGQRPPEPPLVDERHAAPLGMLEHRLLCLLLGANEQDAPSVGYGVANRVVSDAYHDQRLLQVDYVDVVPLGEDIWPHLGVPPAGLVTEMNSRLQEFLHGDYCPQNLSLINI